VNELRVGARPVRAGSASASAGARANRKQGEEGGFSRAWVAAFAAYAALTVAFTWPLAAHLSSAFPHDAFDPAFMTWILWWNAHTVPLTARWWNAPMFWPLAGTLTFSEHLLGISVVTTPLQWLGSSPLMAFNIAVLLSFPLCAAAAHALAFAIVKRNDAAVIAALVFGFSPYRVSHLPHLQMLWAFGLPLALVAGHRYIGSRHRGWLVVFGAAWLLQALSNGYYMLFFPVLLACWLAWFARDRAAWLPLGAAWMAACLPLVPFVWMYERVHTGLGLQRHLREILLFSADVTSLFAASPHLMLWRPLSQWTRQEGELFPGVLALTLVVLAAAAGIQRAHRAAIERSIRMRRGWTWLAAVAGVTAIVAVSPAVVGPWKIGAIVSVSAVAKPLTIAMMLAAFAIITSRPFVQAWRCRSPLAFYASAAVLMFVLSLGPYPTLAGRRVLFRAPYAWLMELPGYSSVRVPARFGMLFVLCLAIAAGCAFASLTGRISRRARRMLATAATILILVESWPAGALAAPPRRIDALSRGEIADPVVELPLGLVERDIAALYRSMDHRRPIVNGYSGFFPPHYVILEVALRDDDLDALAELAGGASLTVAIDRAFQFDRWNNALMARHATLLAVEGDVYLYRLAGAAAERTLPGERLTIQSIDASVAPDRISWMLDNDWSTAWGTPGPQQGGETVTVDLGREQYVAAIRVDLGGLGGDFPRVLVVECAGERGEWQTCWRGSAAAAALRGALQDTRLVPMTLTLDRAGVRRLRMRSTAADSDRAWSIAELVVFGR
jgi:hypothetical protein